jgi:hypothetical protein
MSRTKNTKNKLDNIEIIDNMISSGELDEYTQNYLSSIKNNAFKNNIIDLEKKLIVSSVYHKKISKMGRNIETMIWQIYRHRGTSDVNKIIKQYGRNNLIINYSINPEFAKNNKIIKDILYEIIDKIFINEEVS